MRPRKLFNSINEKRIGDIRVYKDAIHEKLCKLQYIQNKLIDIVQKVNDILEGEKLEEAIKNITNELDNSKLIRNNYKERVEFWNETYKQIPFIWKILSFIKKYKLKISNKLKIYENEEEKF